jgi:predicted GNAT family acetyltransferase
MNTALLDNPVWHALNSHHRHLAISRSIAARYQPETLLAAAMSEYNSAEFADLRNLVAINEIIGVMGKSLQAGTDWEIVQTFQVPQMICQQLKPTEPINAIPLTSEDVPDMLALVAFAQPGPFLSRTIEMGHYLGIRQDGQLVAMAGERLHLTGFCEVSAVCTHPDYRGRGYGGALTSMVASGIIARGEVPFLHVVNEVAARLYEKLGFRFRKENPVTLLKRLA